MPAEASGDANSDPETLAQRRCALTCVSSFNKRPRRLSPTQQKPTLASASREIWLAHELSNRRAALSIFIQNYAPWFLPQFEAIFALPQLSGAEDQRIPTVQQAADYAAELESRIAEALPSLPSDSPLATSAASLRSLLFEAAQRLTQLGSRHRHDRRRSRTPRRRNALRIPLRRIAPASLHRLRRSRTRTAFCLLRPARLRGPHRILHRRRQGRHPSAIMVPARSLPCHGQRSSRASFLDRNHVRVHDACTMDAHLPQHAHLPFARIRRSASSATTSGTFPGASRSQVSQRWTLKAGTATRPGEFQRWP